MHHARASRNMLHLDRTGVAPEQVVSDKAPSRAEPRGHGSRLVNVNQKGFARVRPFGILVSNVAFIQLQMDGGRARRDSANQNDNEACRGINPDHGRRKIMNKVKHSPGGAVY